MIEKYSLTISIALTFCIPEITKQSYSNVYKESDSEAAQRAGVKKKRGLKGRNLWEQACSKVRFKTTNNPKMIMERMLKC